MQEALYHNEGINDISNIMYRHESLDTRINRHNDTVTATFAATEPFEQTPDVLWRDIQYVLCEPQEQRIAFLLFHCGLTPDEIIQRCGNEFSDVREVMHLRYVVLTKLCTLLSN